MRSTRFALMAGLMLLALGIGRMGQIIKFIPGLLFFGYMSLVSFAFFVLTGTIGFFACYLFIWKIYSSIKVD